MRTTFIETLCDLAEADPNIWLVCGDLGYSVLERFADRFPQRYLNAGVAEQNMTGIAAGLALEGKTVFTYSIANFPVMRCLEQIRNDVCYHKLNVKIVAVGGGMAYGTAGYSHYALEDLAVLQALPNMTVMAPGDPVEVAWATRAIAAHPGPCYLRLGKAGEKRLHEGSPEFRVGTANVLRPGADITIASTGGALPLALRAAESLQSEGISARVLSMHTIKPLDLPALLTAARETGRILTVEEHYWMGGLGASAAAQLTLAGHSCIISSLATGDDGYAALNGQPLGKADDHPSEDSVPAAAGWSSARTGLTTEDVILAAKKLCSDAPSA
jgi:transketolase